MKKHKPRKLKDGHPHYRPNSTDSEERLERRTERQKLRGLIKAIKYDRELCLIVFQAGSIQRKMSDSWHLNFIRNL